jgi:hypothetical protein
VQSILNSLPEDSKNEFVEQLLTVGSVLRCHTKGIGINKLKRVLVIGFHEDKVAVLIINSNPTPEHISKNEKDAELLLPVETCEFLEHNSYLKCHSIKFLDISFVKSALLNDTNVFLGRLDNSTLGTVKVRLLNCSLNQRAALINIGIIPKS